MSKQKYQKAFYSLEQDKFRGGKKNTNRSDTLFYLDLESLSKVIQLRPVDKPAFPVALRSNILANTPLFQLKFLKETESLQYWVNGCRCHRDSTCLGNSWTRKTTHRVGESPLFNIVHFHFFSCLAPHAPSHVAMFATIMPNPLPNKHVTRMG